MKIRSRRKDMVELDPETFNKMFRENQNEITRIFKHIFQKYPSPDGHADAFNTLFVALFELRIFQRWNVARVVYAEVKRRTGSQRKADAVYRRLSSADTEEAEKVAMEMGINLKSKRGQFLYKWIEHVMGDHYLKRGKVTRRFCGINPDASCQPSWRSTRRNVGFSPWMARSHDYCDDHYEGSGAWGVAVNHQSRHFPHFEEAPTCVSEFTSANALCSIEDEVEHTWLSDSLCAGLDPVDRAIVDKRIEGYTIREIQAQLAKDPDMPTLTHQALANRLNKIRTKPATQPA